VTAAAAALLSLPPGIAIGSFLNVVAARVPLRQSVVQPASRCMSCEHELAWYDNIPLVSFLALRGRCRYCRASIGWRYPAVELTTALLVSCAFLKLGATWTGLLAASWCAVLVALSAIDLEHRIVPNRIVLPAAAAVLAAHTLIDPSIAWILGALGASLFLFVTALVYPKGMGMGDVKLALLLGAMLGKLVAVGMFLGMVSALVPSVVLLARHGPAARKMGIPFAPFLALGAVVALFAGEPIWHWYRHLGH
jgi:leader peptidase (prepilin peptidase)/N-methyltransferase